MQEKIVVALESLSSAIGKLCESSASDHETIKILTKALADQAESIIQLNAVAVKCAAAEGALLTVCSVLLEEYSHDSQFMERLLKRAELTESNLLATSISDEAISQRTAIFNSLLKGMI